MAIEDVSVAQLENGTGLILRLRELRGARSFAELSRCTGIRADELSRIESGKTKAIAWSTLARLLDVLQIRADELLEVRKPTALDSITAGMLAAIEAGKVSEETANVWARGRGRLYGDDETWSMSEPDETAQPPRRRSATAV